jgi:hypothetical protein
VDVITIRDAAPTLFAEVWRNAVRTCCGCASARVDTERNASNFFARAPRAELGLMPLE